MRDLEERHAAELAELLAREEALKRERRELAERQEGEVEQASAVRDKAEQAYRDAITAWAAS